MNEILVSVIIPTYNREKSLMMSINSVLEQTVKNIEVIIVDDGSTDNTRGIIYSINDKRVKYIYQDNKGACEARNNGIRHAVGKYIAFHDSDDVWNKTKLERQLFCFEKYYPDLVFCKLRIIKTDGEVLLMPTYGKEGFFNDEKNVAEIGTQTIIARRELFEEFRFDPQMPRLQDLELLYRIAKKYKIYCLNEGLVDYYIGEDSISSNSNKLYKACVYMEEKHPEFKKNNPALAYFLSRQLIEEAYKFRIKHCDEYKKYIKKALEIRFSFKTVCKSLLVMLCINPSIKN